LRTWLFSKLTDFMTMARKPLVAAFFRLSLANTCDEDSMLQMPVVEKIVKADASDCRCPGYLESQCLENAFQGCIWTDTGDSNAPWCQCDPDFVYNPLLFVSPPAPPPTEPTCLAKDARVVVIGGGPSGVHMALELKQRGYTSVIVLEKETEASRFGKSQSYTLEDTGDVPHELGTCYLSSSYSYVRELFAKYVGDNATMVPGGTEYNNIMMGSPHLALPFVSLFAEQWFALNVNRIQGFEEMQDAVIYNQIMASEIIGYNELHAQIFGSHASHSAVQGHGLPPRPADDKMELLDMSFHEFMTQNGFPNLLDYTVVGMGSYGFGFDIPALYGLMFVNPVVTMNVLNPTMPGVEVSRKGFSNLWEQIVTQEDIVLLRGHAVTSVQPKDAGVPGYTVVAQVVTPEGSPAFESFDADELIFAIPVNEHVVSNILAESASELEQRIASNLQHVGLHVGLYKAQKQSLTVMLPGQSQPSSFPDQALVFFPEPLTRAFSPAGNGGVYAERNDVLSHNPDADADQSYRYVMAYQHFTDNLYDETAADAEALAQIDPAAEYVTGRAYHDYLPHFNPLAIQDGLPWDIFDRQGEDHKWYIGSSVVFESSEDVVAYNKQVLEKAGGIFCPASQ